MGHVTRRVQDRPLRRGGDPRRRLKDRTVIEDTESTVDLVDAGWGLHDYPTRLAYSATHRTTDRC